MTDSLQLEIFAAVILALWSSAVWRRGLGKRRLKPTQRKNKSRGEGAAVMRAPRRSAPSPGKNWGLFLCSFASHPPREDYILGVPGRRLASPLLDAKACEALTARSGLLR